MTLAPVVPSSVRQLVSLDGPPLRGQSARARLQASDPGFLWRFGPPSVAWLRDWPVSDYKKLAAADEINHLGACEH